MSHSPSPAGAVHRAVSGWVLVCALLTWPALASADDTAILRVFLRDGTTLGCYGEYARVDDRIVFSMPLGTSQGAPRLQLVELHATRVDWDRTDRYRETARAARYAAVHGDNDYALLTGDVARVLNEIALTTDAVHRLRLAEGLQRTLAEWPGRHYGYRASEVREIAALVDEAVSELRAATGGNQFDLNLVAYVQPPPAEPLMPAPTAAETIAQALTVAELTEDPGARVEMLRATIAFIDEGASSVSAPALANARLFADARLQREIAHDRAYARLAQDLAGRAEASAARADVRGVERILASVQSHDAALGGQRPDRVRALTVTLQAKLDAARRLRLARDQWRLRRASYRSYSNVVKTPMAQLAAMRAALEDIKALAGPDTETLRLLGDHAGVVQRRLSTVVPPPDLASVHGLLVSASQMAGNAAAVRLQAISSGDMATAWNASSAAAGALLLVGRARDELARYIAPPRLP